MKKILNKEEAAKLMASLVDFAADNADRTIKAEIRRGYEGYPELTVEIRDRDTYEKLSEGAYTILNTKFTASDVLAEITTYSEAEE